MWRLFKEIVCIDNDNIGKKQQSQHCTKTGKHSWCQGGNYNLNYYHGYCYQNALGQLPWIFQMISSISNVTYQKKH